MEITKEDILKYGTKDEIKEMFGSDKLNAADAITRVNRALGGWLSIEERKNFTEEYLLTLRNKLYEFIEAVENELRKLT